MMDRESDEPRQISDAASPQRRANGSATLPRHRATKQTTSMQPEFQTVERVTLEHGRAFVKQWFRRSRADGAIDEARCDAGIMTWPDEDSPAETESQRAYFRAEAEIFNRLEGLAGEFIATMFAQAANEVLHPRRSPDPSRLVEVRSVTAEMIEHVAAHFLDDPCGSFTDVLDTSDFVGWPQGDDDPAVSAARSESLALADEVRVRMQAILAPSVATAFAQAASEVTKQPIGPASAARGKAGQPAGIRGHGIREIFLRPQAEYSVEEAADLLGVPASRIWEHGDAFAYREQGHMTLEDVLLEIVCFYSTKELSGILSGEGDDDLRHLLPRGREIQSAVFNLPKYLADYLEYEATRLASLRGGMVVDADAALENILEDGAICDEEFDDGDAGHITRSLVRTLRPRIVAR